MATMNKNEGFLTFKDKNGMFHSVNMSDVSDVKFNQTNSIYENLTIAFFDKKGDVSKMIVFGELCGDDIIEIGFNEAYSIQKMFGVNILKGYD
jgi:hypothetical protein